MPAASVTIHFDHIDCGDDYCLAIAAPHGTAVGWHGGQDLTGRTMPPVGFLFSQLSAGPFHACGVTQAGPGSGFPSVPTLALQDDLLTLGSALPTAHCWGRGSEGQLDVPTQDLAKNEHFTSLTAGGFHSCGVTNLNHVYCFGDNSNRQSSVPPSYQGRYDLIAAGTYHTCASTLTKVLVCWGVPDARTSPPALAAVDSWSDLSCYEDVCCAVLDAAQVTCWGLQAFGQTTPPVLGDIYQDNQDTVFWDKVSCGSFHCCGIDSLAMTHCWGSNDNGQCDTPPLKTKDVAAGGSFICGLDTDGNATCWGGGPVYEEISKIPTDESTMEPVIHVPAPNTDVSQRLAIEVVLPEWPSHNTVTITLVNAPLDVFSDEIRLVTDPDTPHILTVNADFARAGSFVVYINSVNMSQHWHPFMTDSASPLFTSISSNGSLPVPLEDTDFHHRLLEGAIYDLIVSYQDVFDHEQANVTATRLTLRQDNYTEAPELVSLHNGSWLHQEINLRYHLPEAMAEWTAFLILSLSPSSPVNDTGAPYYLRLSWEGCQQGPHDLLLTASNLSRSIDSNVSPYLPAQIHRGGPLLVDDFNSSDGASIGLVDGASYDLELQAQDADGNEANSTYVYDLFHWIDRFTESAQLQVDSLPVSQPLSISYRIPEPAKAGSLLVDIEEMVEWDQGARDPIAPYSFTVVPKMEEYGVWKTIELLVNDLFLDPSSPSMAPHPLLRTASQQPTSKVTHAVTTEPILAPFTGYLRDGTRYRIRLSYQDYYGNPVALSYADFTTRFMAPSKPPLTSFALRKAYSTSLALNVTYRPTLSGGLPVLEMLLEVYEDARGLGTNWAELPSRTMTLSGFDTHLILPNLRSSTSYGLRLSVQTSTGQSPPSDVFVARTVGLCGDGIREESEGCDDANIQPGDGCNSWCEIETGWTCGLRWNAPDNITQYLYCSPIHGDGIRVGSEECDDMNRLENDGCDNHGLVEKFYSCSPGPSGHDDCNIDCGNLIDGDGCSSNCTIETRFGFTCKDVWSPSLESFTSECQATCPDGFRFGGEECDDANINNNDGCTRECKVAPGWVCVRLKQYPADAQSAIGDLRVNKTNLEEMRNGVELCLREACGDGKLNPYGLEECDDGNLNPNDGCDHLCRIEKGWLCDEVLGINGSACIPNCSDGYRVPAHEACDDGDLIGGDGCNEVCQVEEGWECFSRAKTGQPDLCLPKCGDSLLIKPLEQCDDSNTLSGDGCSRTCQIEKGFTCYRPRVPAGVEKWAHRQYQPDMCVPECSDGIRMPERRGGAATGSGTFVGQQCDDGNLVNGDGCSVFCEIERGYFCHEDSATSDTLPEGGGPAISLSVCHPLCGDMMIKDTEQCDGDTRSADGCAYPNCTVEEGWVCPMRAEVGEGQPCVPICGDGRKLGLEECDDGNTHNDDGCSSSCTIEPFWECAIDIMTEARRSTCFPICGDGYTAGGESCDDMNIVGGDGCSPSCLVEESYECCPASLDPSAAAVYKRMREELANSPSVDRLTLTPGVQLPLIKGPSECSLRSPGEPLKCPSTCGNGVLESPHEQCDDGNLLAADGCDDRCRIEQGFQCACPRECFVPEGVPLSTPDRAIICRCKQECAAECGDAFKSDNEECDLGNQSHGGGCSDCRIARGWECHQSVTGPGMCLPVCNDGLRVGDEHCDTGGIEQRGCSAKCTVEEGYECAGGSALSTDQCDIPLIGLGEGSTPAGSGVFNWTTHGITPFPSGMPPSLPTGCDAGVCMILTGYMCLIEPINGTTECRAVCGDGIFVQEEESCDDGNLVDGDGCSSQCLIEEGWLCELSFEGMEQGPLTFLQVTGPAANETSTAQAGSTDDAFVLINETLSARQDQVQVQQAAKRPISVCRPHCGDGTVHPLGEECDDGNAWASDGCSKTCIVESTFSCDRREEMGGKPSVCSPIFGDGYETGGETCDTGALFAAILPLVMPSADPLSLGCLNGKTQPGYHCTRGAPLPPVNRSEYLSNVTALIAMSESVELWSQRESGSDGGLPPSVDLNLAQAIVDSPYGPKPSICQSTCGNGRLDAHEECETSNTTGSTESCQSCRYEGVSRCSDGIVQPSEECDDGDTSSGDGCDSGCKIEKGYECTRPPASSGELSECSTVCGDSILVEAMEQCDDGNLLSGDGCNVTCGIEDDFYCFRVSPSVDAPNYPLPSSICVEAVPSRVVSATFSPSFAAISLSFSPNPVVIGGVASTGGPPTTKRVFPCQSLFGAEPLRLLEATNGDMRAGQASCSFDSPGTARIVVAEGATVRPGSVLAIEEGAIRRYRFAPGSANEAQNVTVEAGTPQIPLRAIISGPGAISRCMGADLSGAYSTIPGLPTWPIMYKWRVHDVNALETQTPAAASAELLRLQTVYSNSPQLVNGSILSFVASAEWWGTGMLPPPLTSGFLYTFELTITDVLGQSASTRHSMQILPNEAPVPVVHGFQPPAITLSEGDPLLLEIEVLISYGCTGLRQLPPAEVTALFSKSPSLEWTGTNDSQPIHMADYLTEGDKSRRLFIPANKLVPGTYVFTATACLNAGLCGKKAFTVKVRETQLAPLDAADATISRRILQGAHSFSTLEPSAVEASIMTILQPDSPRHVPALHQVPPLRVADSLSYDRGEGLPSAYQHAPTKTIIDTSGGAKTVVTVPEGFGFVLAAQLNQRTNGTASPAAGAASTTRDFQYVARPLEMEGETIYAYEVEWSVGTPFERADQFWPVQDTPSRSKSVNATLSNATVDLSSKSSSLFIHVPPLLLLPGVVLNFRLTLTLGLDWQHPAVNPDSTLLKVTADQLIEASSPPGGGSLSVRAMEKAATFGLWEADFDLRGWSADHLPLAYRFEYQPFLETRHRDFYPFIDAAPNEVSPNVTEANTTARTTASDTDEDFVLLSDWMYVPHLKALLYPRRGKIGVRAVVSDWLGSVTTSATHNVSFLESTGPTLHPWLAALPLDYQQSAVPASQPVSLPAEFDKIKESIDRLRASGPSAVLQALQEVALAALWPDRTQPSDFSFNCSEHCGEHGRCPNVRLVQELRLVARTVDASSVDFSPRVTLTRVNRDGTVEVIEQQLIYVTKQDTDRCVCDAGWEGVACDRMASQRLLQQEMAEYILGMAETLFTDAAAAASLVPLSSAYIELHLQVLRHVLSDSSRLSEGILAVATDFLGVIVLESSASSLSGPALETVLNMTEGIVSLLPPIPPDEASALVEGEEGPYNALVHDNTRPFCLYYVEQQAGEPPSYLCWDPTYLKANVSCTTPPPPNDTGKQQPVTTCTFEFPSSFAHVYTAADLSNVEAKLSIKKVSPDRFQPPSNLRKMIVLNSSTEGAPAFLGECPCGIPPSFVVPSPFPFYLADVLTGATFSRRRLQRSPASSSAPSFLPGWWLPPQWGNPSAVSEPDTSMLLTSTLRWGDRELPVVSRKAAAKMSRHLQFIQEMLMAKASLQTAKPNTVETLETSGSLGLVGSFSLSVSGEAVVSWETSGSHPGSAAGAVSTSRLQYSAAAPSSGALSCTDCSFVAWMGKPGVEWSQWSHRAAVTGTPSLGIQVYRANASTEERMAALVARELNSSTSDGATITLTHTIPACDESDTFQKPSAVCFNSTYVSSYVCVVWDPGHEQWRYAFEHGCQPTTITELLANSGGNDTVTGVKVSCTCPLLTTAANATMQWAPTMSMLPVPRAPLPPPPLPKPIVHERKVWWMARLEPGNAMGAYLATGLLCFALSSIVLGWWADLSERRRTKLKLAKLDDQATQAVEGAEKEASKLRDGAFSDPTAFPPPPASELLLKAPLSQPVAYALPSQMGPPLHATMPVSPSSFPQHPFPGSHRVSDPAVPQMGAIVVSEGPPRTGTASSTAASFSGLPYQAQVALGMQSRDEGQVTLEDSLWIPVVGEMDHDEEDSDMDEAISVADDEVEPPPTPPEEEEDEQQQQQQQRAPLRESAFIQTTRRQTRLPPIRGAQRLPPPHERVDDARHFSPPPMAIDDARLSDSRDSDSRTPSGSPTMALAATSPSFASAPMMGYTVGSQPQFLYSTWQGQPMAVSRAGEQKAASDEEAHGEESDEAEDADREPKTAAGRYLSRFNEHIREFHSLLCLTHDSGTYAWAKHTKAVLLFLRVFSHTAAVSILFLPGMTFLSAGTFEGREGRCSGVVDSTWKCASEDHMWSGWDVFQIFITSMFVSLISLLPSYGLWVPLPFEAFVERHGIKEEDTEALYIEMFLEPPRLFPLFITSAIAYCTRQMNKRRARKKGGRRRRSSDKYQTTTAPSPYSSDEAAEKRIVAAKGLFVLQLVVWLVFFLLAFYMMAFVLFTFTAEHHDKEISIEWPEEASDGDIVRSALFYRLALKPGDPERTVRLSGFLYNEDRDISLSDPAPRIYLMSLLLSLLLDMCLVELVVLAIMAAIPEEKGIVKNIGELLTRLWWSGRGEATIFYKRREGSGFLSGEDGPARVSPEPPREEEDDAAESSASS
ncbi:unnamed protein product [Vitrella brassicaformis CCMP3155]|uniref:Fibronectin type-III domain-containing protein n=10 Tax=Vitrella brassicaformis TaxID=1169539 RepID=A0A0G4EL81_VITBC|nr:unnamed protein product [Vitrella brassicaformis CCMP3155]|eukprot:CEL97712.1 unnamed protein product [Vitrella brassicaformis CCMP3155]